MYACLINSFVSGQFYSDFCVSLLRVNLRLNNKETITTGDEDGNSTVGQVQDFIRAMEEWTQYWDHFQCYCQANGITDATKKRAILLSSVGCSTYKLLSSLTAPAKPVEKSLDDLNALLPAHFNPTPSPIVQSFKFYNRSRQPVESILTFLAELS